MHHRVLCVMLAVFVGSLAFAGKPEITSSGTFYIYSFFWHNADFDTGATADGDQFFYMHADLGINADFGSGISTKVTVGGWGTFGLHPVTGEGSWGHLLTTDKPGEDVAVREAYLDIANLFDSPICFRAGKMHVLYGDGIYDGGEDGAMGAKFYANTEGFEVDLSWYRLYEGGGRWYEGTGWEYFFPEVPDDIDLFGLWLTGKFVEGFVRVAPYWFYRTYSYYDVEYGEYTEKDNPMWLGGRLDVGPLAGLTLAGEFTMMMGDWQRDWEDTLFTDESFDYAGMHYMGRFSFAPLTLPVFFGVGYVAFSGNEIEYDTLGNPLPDTENELYESPIWGPYTFGFYKWWPGFGPAHVQKTPFGFSLLTSDETLANNLNVINANVGFYQGPLTVRADFFKYSRNWVASGDESDMGYEIALLTTYTFRKTLTLGGTVGYWTPGDYFGTDVDPMIGGYLFAYLSF
ncbi:MAG: hypothetical protein JSW49_01840 [candidate division WOR-3 bacterium]|nr:MAG: hypothetical protein JSW49_01840 [candidate division WOR-3 bacterium]